MKLAPTAAHRLAPGFVVLAACAIYLNSIGNDFALDDVYIVHQNTRVHNLAAWRDIWLTPYWPFLGAELGLYRPFAIFLYAVQWAIGGGAPWLFHATSILLHAIATLLVFLLLERLTARTPALVGALIFAVHPVHTEAVANIVGQAEVVAAIVLLGACLVHMSRPAGAAVSWPRRAALCALFAVGLLAKESAVVLPGLLVAVDFAQRRMRPTVRGFADYADAMLMPLLLLTATLAFYLILRFDVMSGTLIGVDAGPMLPFLREEERILNALRAFPEFVRLLFFPRDLSSDYAPGVILPVESVTMMTLLGAVLLVTAVGLALLTPWWPFVGLPAAWFLISIITVSNLFFPIGVLIAERTLYLPSVAVSVILAYASLAAARRASLRARRLAAGFVVVVLLLFSVRTWTRNPVWESTQSVLTHLAREHPESYKAQWVQASLLWRSGKVDDAHFRFAVAYRIYRRDSELMVEYAEFLQGRGKDEEAVALLEQAYAMHPYIPRTVLVLAHAYLVVGRYPLALTRIAEAEALGAPRPLSMPLRAQAYAGLGAHDKAVGAWRVALRERSLNTSWIAWAFLARTLAISGYDHEAASALDRGRSLAADSAAHLTLERLRSAIRKGCFDRIVPATSIPPGPATSDCDPIGDDYFRFDRRQAEIASLLHNASMLPPLDTGSVRVETRSK